MKRFIITEQEKTNILKMYLGEQTSLLSIPSPNISFASGGNTKQILLKAIDPKTKQPLTLKYNIKGSYKFMGFDVELRNIRRGSNGNLLGEVRPSNGLVFSIMKNLVPGKNLAKDGWLYIDVPKASIDKAILQLRNNEGSEAEIEVLDENGEDTGVEIELSLAK